MPQITNSEHSRRQKIAILIIVISPYFSEMSLHIDIL